jgi:hypothetical protein
MYQPTSTCIGINGSLPIAWATWSSGVIQNDQGLQFQLVIDFSGTMNWDAMATSYGDIGTSYSAPENWALAFENAVQLGSRVTQPGSFYWYYGGATWAIVNYEILEYIQYHWYQVGTTTVSEVLYVPPNDNNVNPAFDYGNGTISLLYYGAIPASRQYFGYPALNASSVVDYAAFSNGYMLQCNGPVYTYTGASGTYYGIILGGVNTAYSLSTAEIGTELGGLVLGISSTLTAPSTSITVTSTYIEFFNVTTGTNLYISVVNASAVYGLPTFGFILNATNFYGNPTKYTCNATRIG